MKDKYYDKIAVVGIGALFPDAHNTNEFWNNIISKKVSIKKLPEEFFESEIYYRPELRNSFSKQNKSYTNIAAFIENLDYNTVRKFKIPPSVAEHMDPNQHAALYSADQAIKEINIESVDKKRISVIYGNGSVGTRYGDAIVGVQFDKIKHYLRKYPALQDYSDSQLEDLFEYLRKNALDESIPITEDSAPGILPNIIAARISNVFDLHGPSFTIDSACASAITAVISGIKSLRLNESDAVICGGSDMPIKSLGLIFFSAINALSPDGSFPFDERANGFVMGQGSGTVILKRLEDAIENKDKIYAVINGYGEASDGKGKYIAAPNPDWQAYSIEKACTMAGYPVDTIELIEAHGTGTTVGDVVEVDGLKKAFSKLGYTRTNYCGLSSVKSNIGHLKSAAGIAGLIKGILALHHKKLPPTASIQNINPKLALQDSPFYVLDELKDWEENPNFPRRANVSAFGFGGADYHLALEEYREGDYSSKNYLIESYIEKEQQTVSSNIGIQNKWKESSSVVYFSADSFSGLKTELENFRQRLFSESELNRAEFVKLHNLSAEIEKGYRLSFFVQSLEEIIDKIELFITKGNQLASEILKTKGIYYKNSEPVTPDQIAILFPGQASQYVNMFSGMKRDVQIFENIFDKADSFWLKKHAFTVSSLIYGDEDKTNKLIDDLKETQNTHPSIFAASYALFKYLSDNGLKANYMIGHSLGEITALAAAEKIDFSEALQLVSARGYSFKDAELDDNGKMISVAKNYEESEGLIKESGLKGISIANINSKKQTIIAGSSKEIEKFKSYLDENKISNKTLYVSHAFHTDLMKPVGELFFDRTKNIRFHKSPIKVIMNHTGKFYPNSEEKNGEIIKSLTDQIVQPVNFVRSIEKLYDKGVKVFVEIGPNSVLTSLTKNILEEKDVSVLTSNFKNSDDIEAIQKLNASLFAEGIFLNPISSKKENWPTENPQSRNEEKKEQNKFASANGRSSIVYSGVSIGLPGSYKEMFRDDNFDQIFEGRNFIERLTDEEKQKMVDLRISKLIKEEKGAAFKLLSSLDDVIQLAGKAGKIDMIKDYHIDENEIKKMTKPISFGIAAAYEALRDAHIPLVQQYTRTSTGKLLPGKLTLPEYMQTETGVIFANGFPMVDPIIEEVSKYIGYFYGSKNSREIISFYESIISRVKDDEAKKLLTDWFTLSYSRLNNINEQSIYNFNHNFMSQISSQANNRIAQLINAKGPNFQMNAACSSTSNAITIGEDFIRSGRVKRMIIVGSDDSTSGTNLPLLGAGFLATGAATNEADLYKAAVPFDIKRNGMIMSSGAVGIILEDKEEVRKRGIIEICELLGSHSFNTANHPAQIDSDGFSKELDRFIGNMERIHSLDRNSLASNIIYLSHETYTPPRGGCSQTEAAALSYTFKSKDKEIIIGNTKGMTGHAMGAALEEAIAAKSLQLGKIPPVVNLTQKDPLLSDLNISKGGSHNRNFALRMSAGFGAQGHFLLLKKAAEGNSRIIDKSKYQNWLDQIAGITGAETKLEGRILIVDGVPKERIQKDEPSEITYVEADILAGPKRSSNISVKSEISDESILDVLSKLTTYPAEMLESDMEFSADLGIGTEKQLEIAKSLNETFGGERNNLIITDTTTVADIITYFNGGSVDDKKAPIEEPAIPITALPDQEKEKIKGEVIKIFSEVTKYPEDMLDLDMEMEADLGIDTVKQATILSMIGEKYQMERDDSLKLSDYPTIGHILEYVYSSTASDTNTNLQEPAPIKETTEVKTDKSGPDDSAELKNDVISVFSEVTKYPEDMLDLDMEMEADLGIDTVKQATILSILGEKYRLDQSQEFKLSDYPTIGHIVKLLQEKGEFFKENGASHVVTETGSNETSIEESEDIGASEILTELSRQIPVLVDKKLGAKNYDVSEKKILVVGNVHENNIPIYNSISEKSKEIFSYSFPDVKTVEELSNDLIKLDNLEFDIIIDTTFSSMSNPNFSEIDDIDTELLNKVKSRFILYKYLKSKNKLPEKIICLLADDGSHGIDPEIGISLNPIYGAISGLYKSLRKEWDGANIKIIDFAPALYTSDMQFVTKSIIDEIESDGEGIEIAYSGTKKRSAVIIKDKGLSEDNKIQYNEKDTFLITGGASGITYLITKALAKKYNSSFIILGRTQLPSNIHQLSLLSEAELENLRTAIKSDLESKYERVTPKMISDEFNSITHAVEIYRNISSLDHERIKYISCDVADLESLKTAVSEAEAEFGPITVLIHGAGIDRSQLIEKKTIDDFNAVFDTKVKGAINLEKILINNPLKSVSVLSSISGRFGNAAQVDYSSANNFLNAWIVYLKNDRKLSSAFSYSTSGWKDHGMAWRNEFVRKGSIEMGLNLIESDIAVKDFIKELECESNDSEIIIHKGLNGFIENGLSENRIENLPFLDRVITDKNNFIKRAYRMFSPARDAFIEQHKLGDTPIMPAVGYSEIGAEYYALQVKETDQFLFKEISFENPFKLFNGKERELFVESESNGSNNELKLEIKSRFKPKNLNISNTVLHSRMIINSQLGNIDDMNPAAWDLDRSNPTSLPASESLMMIEGSGPKQRIILGPLYNDIVRDTNNKAEVTIFQNAVLYPTNFPEEQFKNKKYPLDQLLVNPCFLDTLYQSCAAHLLVTRKRVYLPWFAQDLGIVSVPRKRGIYTCFAQVIEEDEEIVKYRVSMTDEDDNIRYFVRKIEFRRINL